MQIRRTAAALTSAAALSVTGIAMATPASAAPPERAVTQTGGAAAGLIAAVVQVSEVRVVTLEDSPITVDRVVTIGDINVDIQDVLNNNRILQNILNNNDVDISDVVDIAIVDNVLVVVVDVL